MIAAWNDIRRDRKLKVERTDIPTLYKQNDRYQMLYARLVWLALPDLRGITVRIKREPQSFEIEALFNLLPAELQERAAVGA